jgi:hypothetical protein
MKGFPRVPKCDKRHCGDLGNLNVTNKENKQGTCHIVALPFTLKCILRQKWNYENSNISPCKNITLKKTF